MNNLSLCWDGIMKKTGYDRFNEKIGLSLVVVSVLYALSMYKYSGNTTISVIFFPILVMIFFCWTIFQISHVGDWHIMYFLITYILVQNIICISSSVIINHSMYILITLAKEAIVLVYIIYYLSKGKYNKTDIWGIIGMGLLLLYLIKGSKNTFMSNLSSFRQLYLPFIFYFLGRSMNLSHDRYKKIIKFFINAMTILCLFGLLEYILRDSGFWQNIGIREYTLYIKGIGSQTRGITSGVPNAFYSYDFYEIVGRAVNRMVSTVADAPIFGQLITFALFYVNTYSKELDMRRGEKISLSVLFLICLLLSVSKGGILIYGISCILSIVLVYKKRSVGFVIIPIFLLITIYIAFVMIRSGYASANHYQGFVANLASLPKYIFGRGIGMSGNLAYFSESAVDLDLGETESFWGGAIGQLGIFAFVIYVPFFRSVFQDFSQKGKIINEVSKNVSIVKCLLIGLIIAAALSTSVMSFVSCCMYFFAMGSICNKNYSIQQVPAKKNSCNIGLLVC